MAQTHGDRTLVLVEHFLELGAQDGRCQIALGFLCGFVLEFEQDERVDVEGEGVGRAWGCGAQETFARLFASGGEFALGPVAHELECGLAVNHHGGGQVPVAARRRSVGVTLELAEGVEHLGGGGAVNGGSVQLNKGLLVVVGTAHTQGHRFKHGEVLPVLAAVGQGHRAALLDFVCRHKELVPGGGHALDAGLGHHFGVGPHPVDAVHVHRRGHVVAVVLHHVGHHARQQLVPFFGLGHVVDIGQHAFGCPFLNGWAFDLSGCGRVARHGTALEHGHGVFAATAGHGKVFPLVAFGFEHFLEFASRSGFAARCPVVQHFNGGLGGHRCGRRCCRWGGSFFFFATGGGQQCHSQRCAEFQLKSHGVCLRARAGGPIKNVTRNSPGPLIFH